MGLNHELPLTAIYENQEITAISSDLNLVNKVIASFSKRIFEMKKNS